MRHPIYSVTAKNLVFIILDFEMGFNLILQKLINIYTKYFNIWKYKIMKKFDLHLVSGSRMFQMHPTGHCWPHGPMGAAGSALLVLPEPMQQVRQLPGSLATCGTSRGHRLFPEDYKNSYTVFSSAFLFFHFLSSFCLPCRKCSFTQSV